jgi:hypothetical protein
MTRHRTNRSPKQTAPILLPRQHDLGGGFVVRRLLPSGSEPRLHAAHPARVILIGGEPLGHRFSVWNFVSSSQARLLQAREDWIAGRFPAVAGETECIPFPAPKAWQLRYKSA